MSVFYRRQKVNIIDKYFAPYVNTDAFTSRQTANGLTVVNHSPAVVEMIKGKTVKTTNLLPFPYGFGTQTTSGVTFTVNTDGSISLRGTNTSASRIALYLFNYRAWQAGTFTLSSGLVNENVYLLWQRRVPSGGVVTQKTQTGSTTISITADSASSDTFSLVLWISVGAVCDGITIYPMLNDGPTAKPFVPYFSGLKHANFKAIKSTGKQLIPFPYRQKTETRNGVDIRVNDDGTILFNGTSTVQWYPTLVIYYPETLLKGTYYLSGNPTNAHMSIGVDAKTANGKWIKTLKLKDGTFEVDWNGYERIDIYYVIQNGAVYENLKVYPMLNFGSTAYPEEYGNGNTYELAEYDYINPQKGEIVKGSYTLTLNGGENEKWYADTADGVGRPMMSLLNSGFVKAGYYKGVIPSNDNWKGNFDFVGGSQTGGLGYIRCKIDDFIGNITALREWLQQNPITVCYEVHTPIVETLDYPKEYTAYNGGSEVVEQGGTDNSQWGAIPAPTIKYREAIGIKWNALIR